MVRVGFYTHKGRARDGNEDSYFILPKEKVYIVADGLGGYLAGQQASGLAVSTIAEYFKNKDISDNGKTEIKEHLVSAVEFANLRILQKAKESIDMRGMATTVVMLHINGNIGYFANAGDSRAYILRNRELVQITEDHSYVSELVKSGSLSEEEARNHSERHKITKALGVDLMVKPDIYNINIEEDDIILLCSDGLYGEVSKEEITDILSEDKEMSKIAEKLVDTANKNGGSDNITVVCLKVERGSLNG